MATTDTEKITEEKLRWFIEFLYKQPIPQYQTPKFMVSPKQYARILGYVRLGYTEEEALMFVLTRI